MTDQAKPAPKRGWCPFCERDITLTKDGRLRHHGGALGTGWPPGKGRAYSCRGVGRLPRNWARKGTDNA